MSNEVKIIKPEVAEEKDFDRDFLDLIKMMLLELRTHSPFFGVLASEMWIAGPAKNVPTIGVSPRGVVVYNEKWMKSLEIGQVVGLLLHESLHIALDYWDRFKGSNMEIANWAHDYAINDIIKKGSSQMVIRKKNGDTFKFRVDLPSGGLWDQKFDQMSGEEIYSILFEEVKKKTQDIRAQLEAQMTDPAMIEKMKRDKAIAEELKKSLAEGAKKVQEKHEEATKSAERSPVTEQDRIDSERSSALQAMRSKSDVSLEDIAPEEPQDDQPESPEGEASQNGEGQAEAGAQNSDNKSGNEQQPDPYSQARDELNNGMMSALNEYMDKEKERIGSEYDKTPNGSTRPEHLDQLSEDLDSVADKYKEDINNAKEQEQQAGQEKGEGEPGQKQDGQGQPGQDQEGQGQPGEGQPGQGQPGEGQPGQGQPGQGQPGQGQPGQGQPGQGQPGQGQPGQGQPGQGQPGQGQPGQGQPGQGQPEQGQPGQGQPGQGQPGQGQPGQGQPGQGQPGQGQPGQGQSGQGQPGQGQPGQGQPVQGQQAPTERQVEQNIADSLDNLMNQAENALNGKKNDVSGMTSGDQMTTSGAWDEAMRQIAKERGVGDLQGDVNIDCSEIPGNPFAKEDKEDTKERHRQTLQRAVITDAQLGGQGWGTLPQWARQEIDGILHPPLSFTKKMKKYIGAYGRADLRTFKKRNKRNTFEENRAIFPGSKRNSSKVYVLMDSSGSMMNGADKDTLRRSMGLVKRLATSLGLEVVVVQCDAQVTKVMDTKQALKEINRNRFDVVGQGGSNFIPGFEFIWEKMKESDPGFGAPIIVFTDGAISVPEMPPKNMKMQVMWVTNPGQHAPTERWGQHIVMDDVGAHEMN